MAQATDLVGNPTALLIERLFWLGLGGFLGLAIITSFLRSFNQSKNKTNNSSPEELKNLAKKAIQQNNDIRWLFNKLFLLPQTILPIIIGREPYNQIPLIRW